MTTSSGEFVSAFAACHTYVCGASNALEFNEKRGGLLIRETHPAVVFAAILRTYSSPNLRERPTSILSIRIRKLELLRNHKLELHRSSRELCGTSDEACHGLALQLVHSKLVQPSHNHSCRQQLRRIRNRRSCPKPKLRSMMELEHKQLLELLCKQLVERTWLQCKVRKLDGSCKR